MIGADLTGRKALLIGAGTPVGRALALALAVAGADLALASATTDGEEVMAVRRTRRGVEALGRRGIEYAFDTTLGQNVQVSTRQVRKELGGLDVLVNAQDFFLGGPADKTSDSEWTRSLSLNLSGVFYACRAALREMLPGGGRIINVVQRPRLGDPAGVAAYAAAKQGVVGLTRALAAEYAAGGVAINAIELDRPEQAAGSVAASLDPTGELASLVVFLAANTALITGQVFSLLGGQGSGQQTDAPQATPDEGRPDPGFENRLSG